MTNEDPEPTNTPSKPSEPSSKDRPSFWASALSTVTLDDKRSWFSTAKKPEEAPPALPESTTDSVEESALTTGRDTEANRLAQRIKCFLEDSKNRFKPQNKQVEEPHFDDQGTPIAPPLPLPGTERDSDLYSILSSASILNGPDKGSKGKERQRADDEFRPSSVWSILDRSTADDRSDRSSLMIYSPLIPAMDSLVEVAETIAEPVEPVAVSEPPAPAAPPTWSEWAFSSFKKAPSTAEPTKPRRLWVPSTTKISMQVMWWGYRLYLPPAVLEILNNKQLEATKRATIITAALQWLIGNIPIAAIPPPLQPVVFLLQQLVPVVGYVGAFIAWSWSGVKSFDNGYGVTLTATWILPVALIPATWEASPADLANLEATDTASLLTATPSRLSIEEAERAFSLPPPVLFSPAPAACGGGESTASSTFTLPHPASNILPTTPSYSSSSHITPQSPRSSMPPRSSSSRTIPRTFGPMVTPMSPPPVPLKDYPSHRRPHMKHRSATVPAGNALGLYTPATPTKSFSIRSSSPRVKSPLSTSSTIGGDTKGKKVKHSCCPSCTAAMAARAAARTPRQT